MVSSVMGYVWYLDSGASFHMTSNKEFFSSLEEKDLQMHIEMSDDERYSVTRIGKVTFERHSGKSFILKYVRHVSGLKNNLVYVAMLEDRGYDVIFNEGKVFLRHNATGQVKKIGIRVKNLYKLDVEYFSSLTMKVEKVESRDIGEL